MIRFHIRNICRISCSNTSQLLKQILSCIQKVRRTYIRWKESLPAYIQPRLEFQLLWFQNMKQERSVKTLPNPYIEHSCIQHCCPSKVQMKRVWSIGSVTGWLMVFSHQSKTTTRRRQDKCWTCAFLWCLSHQVCRTWCETERLHRNAQVQHLSCRCLDLVSVKTPLDTSSQGP